MNRRSHVRSVITVQLTVHVVGFIAALRARFRRERRADHVAGLFFVEIVIGFLAEPVVGDAGFQIRFLDAVGVHAVTGFQI